MASSSFLACCCDVLPVSPLSLPSTSRFLSFPRSRPQSQQEIALLVQGSRRQKFRAFTSTNYVFVLQKRARSNDEVIMVDPLEAKRLASIQMQEIKVMEKFKKQRRIEAINGTWAIIGLTAGLIIEGKTGNGILAQLKGYLDALINIF